jgi:hypothetical protein
MRDELQRWLDGEIGDDALPEELREEAERLRGLLDTPRDVGPAPAWLESRVMHDLPRGRPGRTTRLLGWVLQPRTVEVRPVTLGALAAAVLAVLFLWPATAPVPVGPGIVAPDSPVRTTAAREADGQVYVNFVYVAPEAGSIHVAGDFNEWSEAGFALDDSDGDGVWTGRLPLSPGLHKYMFVVDGEWVTDPFAERYVDDGFGNRNALINVTGPGSAI